MYVELVLTEQKILTACFTIHKIQYTQEYLLGFLQSPQAVGNRVFSLQKKANNDIPRDESE